MPGIPSSEKEQLEKSLRYNLWASLIRFIVLNFVLTCVWFFGFGLGFDAIKAATGQQLKGTMTVTGVVQEDGLTLSVKDPNKGKHVVYSLTDLGVDPTGWSYGGRLNTYWSKDEDSGDYSIIAVIPEKEASRIQGLEDAILMTGYFSIIVIGLLIFFVRRRKYTSWYIPDCRQRTPRNYVSRSFFLAIAKVFCLNKHISTGFMTFVIPIPSYILQASLNSCTQK